MNKRTIYTCPECGREFSNKRKHQYEFHKKGPHKWTDEERKEISEKRKKFLRENPDNHPWKSKERFKSKPCEELKQWLRDKKIDFEEEVQVVPGRHYSVDIVFPKVMLIVEVNGYQHYNTDTMELAPYYQKRHNEMEALGWEVLEVPYNQSYSEEFRMGLCMHIDAKQSSKQSNVSSNHINPTPYLKTLADLKKEREKNKEKKDERILLAREQGLKVDSLGRVLTWAPTENDWIERKELILNCGVDLTKFGWVGKVEKATGLTKRIIENTVERFSLEVFKRKAPQFN